MDAKLAWLLENYYCRSQESVGCSSSQADLYLTEKELHQLHLDEEALRETLEEQAMDAKAREEKIRQKQADDDEFFLEFGMLRIDSDYENAYEKCIDISQESRALIDSFLKEGSDKDYELNLSMYGKATKLEKQMDAKLAWLLEKYYYRSQESAGCSSSQADLYLTEKELHQLHLDEEALRETLEEQAMDAKAREEKINSGAWVSATNYVNAFGGTIIGCLRDIDNFLKKEKLEQVVTIVKSCSPNMLGDLNVTLKDLSGTIHYKVLDVGSYGNDITVGAAMILANVSVFTPKPSQDSLTLQCEM
ncbi:transposase, MuDR, MULE transposase domain protein [Tanacetum coccineum]